MTEKLRRITKEQAEELIGVGFKFSYAATSFFTNETNSFWNEEVEDLLELPYLEEVAKWLREDKGILTIPKYIMDDDAYEDYVRIKSTFGTYGSGKVFKDYDDALSRGIDNAIGFLKKLKV